MTPKQESLYWREWSAARAALRELGHKIPDNELRHWLTAQALGKDKPHRAFTNLDFDRFLGVARGYSSMADLGEQLDGLEAGRVSVGHGRTVKAGGMVYVSSLGPIEPVTGQVIRGGIKEQTGQCLRNLKERLEAEGSSLEKVVWATWSLKDPADFDTFNEEWARWFPGDTPVGQGTLMPPLQRRAGFRISIGVIAEA
jgi:2-iminobutanoate/2-iminopropanoate deaminase